MTVAQTQGSWILIRVGFFRVNSPRFLPRKYVGVAQPYNPTLCAGSKECAGTPQLWKTWKGGLRGLGVEEGATETFFSKTGQNGALVLFLLKWMTVLGIHGEPCFTSVVNSLPPS